MYLHHMVEVYIVSHMDGVKERKLRLYGDIRGNYKRALIRLHNTLLYLFFIHKICVVLTTSTKQKEFRRVSELETQREGKRDN